MKIIDIIRMAAGDLSRNRMRTTLTVAGVVVGIGAIVFLVSLGFGLQALMVSKVANLDALSVITVRPGNKEDTNITKETIERFKSFEEAIAVSPILSYPAQIEQKDTYSETVVYGLEPRYLEFEDLKVDYGEKSLNENAKEAIVSVASLKTLNLTNPDTVIGKELEFKIIQLDESGNIKKGHEDERIYCPIYDR